MVFSPLRDRNIPLYALLCGVLVLNIGLWFTSRDIRPSWANVPPVTSERAALGIALGDRQFGYRTIGLFLQNLGSTGGQDQNLRDYYYDRLAGWFFLADALDAESNFIPVLAAFYYGVVRDPGRLAHVVDYLSVVGQRPQPHKWRWLAHAVFIARYQMNDLNRALELAHTLAALPSDDLPFWAAQMPVFIMNAQGDKQAAYSMMVGMLASGVDKMDPTEIRFIRDYVCDRILTPEQAARDDLCTAGR